VSKVSSNDIIIIGAGVSGLILANEIIQRTNRKVLILEKKKKFIYEKNLCFWNIPKNELTKLFNNKWKQIVINIDDEKKKLIDKDIEYLRINSKTLYDFYINKLKSNSRFSIIMDCEVTSKKNYNEVHISTNKGKYKAKFVFDSIPEEFTFNKKCLYQHFVGLEIKCKRDIFKVNEVTLMDIQEKNNLFNFLYVLPFSKNLALVESTYFSSKTFKKSTYINDIKNYINKKYNIKEFSVKFCEAGIIPMTRVECKTNKNIVKIGVAGNWVKMSSGYSLQNSFIYSKQIVDCILNNKYPKISSKPFMNFLDTIFCKYILKYPNHVKHFLKSFFFKNSLISVVKFLCNRSSFIETLNILIKLPKIKIIKILLRL